MTATVEVVAYARSLPGILVRAAGTSARPLVSALDRREAVERLSGRCQGFAPAVARLYGTLFGPVFGGAMEDALRLKLEEHARLLEREAQQMRRWRVANDNLNHTLAAAVAALGKS